MGGFSASVIIWENGYRGPLDFIFLPTNDWNKQIAGECFLVVKR